MAHLRTHSGPLVEAALRPMLAEETRAANDWPELHFEPASWIEGDQVWVLELQPYDPANVGGDLEKTQHLASDKNVEDPSSLGESKLSPVKGARVPECQSWSDEASLQANKSYISDGEALGHSLQLTTEQSTHTKKIHICDQYGKDFQSPSDRPQHYQHLHCREKTAGQEPSQMASFIQSALAPISLLLQTDNKFADSRETISPKQMQTTEPSIPTNKLHICNHCGKGFGWLSQFVQHQLAHSGGETAKQSPCQSEIPSPNPLAPVPLQDKENLLADSCEMLCQNSTLAMNQSTPSKNLLICEHCGKGYRWRSDLYRHQRVHHGRNATNQRQHQSEESLLVSVTLPLMARLTDQNTGTNKRHICDPCGKAFRKPYDLALHYRRHHPGREVAKTDQNIRNKNLHICDQCGKGYRWRSDLCRHLRVHHGIKVRKQREPQSEADPMVPAPLPMQAENTSVAPESAFRTKSKPTTDQSTRTKKQHNCDQCEKAFRKPYDLALHYQRRHPGRTIANQREHQSGAGSLVPVESPSQEENTFVSPVSALRPKSKLKTTRTNNLHICDQCGMGYQWLSHLVHHRSVHHGIKAGKQRGRHSKASPLVSAPLQEDKTFASPEFTSRPKLKPVKDQNPPTKYRHICHLCEKGFRWPSDLARHQYSCYRRKAAGQTQRQSKGSSLVSVTLPLPAEKTLVAPESVFMPKTMPTPYQSTRTTKQHICQHCGRGYQWPSDLARHKLPCYRRKAAGQRQHQSKGSPLVSVTLPLPAEKTLVAPECVFTPKSMPTPYQSTCTTNQHICQHCGKGYRWPSDLARHQRVDHGRKTSKRRKCQSEAGPLVPVTLPLQGENMFVSPGSVFRSKSNPRTDQITCTKEQHVCDQFWRCCSRKSCALAQHYPCHHSSEEPTRQGQGQSDPCSCSALAPISLQAADTFAGSCETASQKSKLVTDQSTCVKNRPICGQYGKGFQSPSELMDHDQCVRSREKAVPNLHRCGHYGKSIPCLSDLASCLSVHFGEQATVRRPGQPEADSPSPLASVPQHAKNTLTDSPEIFNPRSMLMADSSTLAMSLRVCDHYQNGFWWPSEPAQHLSMHSGEKAAGWGQFYSKGCRPGPLESYPLQTGKTAAHSCNTFYPNSQLVTDQSPYRHTCSHCGNVCQWTPALDQHQQARSGANMSIPVSLHGENAFTNSMQMRDLNTETQNLHICNYSGNGFQWPSELPHPSRHSWGGIAREDQCQSKGADANLSMSVSTFLQVVSMLANCQKAIGPNPMQMANRHIHSKMPFLCDQDGEGVQWPSDLAQLAHTHSRGRPYRCAVCGSRFTRKVQLVKHQRLHEETHDHDREEEDRWPQGGCGEEASGGDIPTEQPQWLPSQGTEELCEPFASAEAGELDVCPTGASNSTEPPPPNSIWEIGVSGHPYIMSLGHPCECGTCGSCDGSSIDLQPTEPSSLGIDETTGSDLASTVGFCYTSTPLARAAAWGADENVEGALRKEGSLSSPPTTARPASQNLEGPPALSLEPEPPLVGKDKPYACPKCPKQFGSRYKLLRHVAIHQKKKPHRCKTCGKRFTHRSYLAKHQWMHTV